MKTGFMVAVIAALVSMPAGAEVQTIVPASAPVGREIVPTIDIGTPAASPKVISGDGANVPLRDALRKVMQFDGWHAFIGHGVDGHANVSWHGGVPWTAALKNIAVQAGITAEVDWVAKTVTLTPGKFVPPRASVDVTAGVTGSGVPLPVWRLTPADGTIKTAISRWAKQGGWRVSWEMPDGEDFHFDQSAAYMGTFENAVHQLAESLKDSAMPFKAVFYMGNHVLRIIPNGEDQ